MEVEYTMGNSSAVLFFPIQAVMFAQKPMNVKEYENLSSVGKYGFFS